MTSAVLRFFARPIALASAIVILSGASAADASSIDVGSAPRWLAGDDDGVSALLADGRVVSIRGKKIVARGEGLSADAPLHNCSGELLGVATDGALVSIDAKNRVSRSAAALLSPRGGLACGLVAVWGITPDGKLLRFERRDRQWVAVKQVSVDALPDARLVLSDLAGDGGPKLFVLAEGSATRYRHGVLGDAVEPTALLMIDPHSLAIEARLALPAPMVFEDLLPRPLSIAARPALALVSASPTGGAALTLIGLEHGMLAIVASGPDFGQASRWLNPLVGASSLYAVLTPHIGGMLYRYERRGDKLAPMPLATEVSTHRIGSRQLEGAAVIERPGGRVLILLPSQAQSRLIALDCNGRCETRASYPLAGVTSSNLLVTRGFAWIGDEAGFLNRIALPHN